MKIEPPTTKELIAYCKLKKRYALGAKITNSKLTREQRQLAARKGWLKRKKL